MTYTFHLNENVTWHDGVPFSAEDVLFNVTEFLPKVHPRARLVFAHVSSVEAPDRNTVVFKMKEAFAKADNILATAAKCITDVINSTGQINVDFEDVCTVMRNGGVAILGSAAAKGDSRAQKAIEEALARTRDAYIRWRISGVACLIVGGLLLAAANLIS